jgi:hypothetical protein
MKTFRFALQIALGVGLPLAVQIWHSRRLTPAQREAAWNGATWGAALYAFGPASMLGWCWVTRGAWPFRPAVRGLIGIGAGVVATFAISLIIHGIDALVALAVGAPS